jgi:excisionase family DNA binding protein
MHGMPKLMIIHKVARLLDCSRPMVYKLIYSGELKCVRIGKRGLRVSVDSLEEFIKKNTVSPDDFYLDDEAYNNGLKAGDAIVIPLDSEEYNELRGQRLTVTSSNNKGVYAKESREPGTGVFIPNGYYNIPRG